LRVTLLQQNGALVRSVDFPHGRTQVAPICAARAGLRRSGEAAPNGMRTRRCDAPQLPSWAEEMAARLPHGVVETERTNVEIPLLFGLALVPQLAAALPDPGGSLVEFGRR